MMKLLPAVAEKEHQKLWRSHDSDSMHCRRQFCPSSRRQILKLPNGKCIEFMLENGVYGAGQSSWGPTVYGVVKSSEAKKL